MNRYQQLHMFKHIALKVAGVLLVGILAASPVHMHPSTDTTPAVIQLVETETNTLENELNVYHLFAGNVGLDGIVFSKTGKNKHIYPSNDLLIEIPTPPPENFRLRITYLT